MSAFGSFQIRGRRVSPPSAASFDTTRNIPIVERQDQVDLYVRKATLEYTASARYDESIDVGIKTRRIGNTSMLIGAAVFRGDQLLISGELVCVYANPATQTPLPVPPALRELLMAF